MILVTEISGNESERHIGMDIMRGSESLGSVMVMPLTPTVVRGAV